MSVGSMPSSCQSGLPTFIGVSMKMAGLRVEKQNSQKIDDQSVTRMSEVKTVLFELKSCSKYKSDSGTSVQRAKRAFHLAE